MKNLTLSSLQNIWKQMLVIFTEDFKGEGIDHVIAYYSPRGGELAFGFGSSPLENHMVFPNIDDYDFSKCCLDSESEPIEIIYEAGLGNEKYSIYDFSGQLIDYKSDELVFSKPFIDAVGMWTLEYLREIKSPVKKFYFQDADHTYYYMHIVSF